MSILSRPMPRTNAKPTELHQQARASIRAKGPNLGSVLRATGVAPSLREVPSVPGIPARPGSRPTL